MAASRKSRYREAKTRGPKRLRRWLLTSFLYLSQPLARLYGRVRHGLTPWRCRARVRSKLPRRWSTAIWSERWHEPEAWVRLLREAIGRHGSRVAAGGPYDRWDLEISGGALAKARLLRDPKVTAKLRAARDVTGLYAILTGEPASHAA